MGLKHRIAVALAACALALPAVPWLGMQTRLFRAPYPDFGKAVAWGMGVPEPAYNFDVVRPGALYRSAAPDPRLVHYARDRYGVRHVVSLSGPSPGHETARELGMRVTVLEWPGDQPPPEAELEHVLRIIDAEGPVLVHCEHGAVRTGFTMAAYRVLREHWPRDRALSELQRYDPAEAFSSRMHRGLARLALAPEDWPPRLPPVRSPRATGARRPG